VCEYEGEGRSAEKDCGVVDPYGVCPTPEDPAKVCKCHLTCKSCLKGADKTSCKVC